MAQIGLKGRTLLEIDGWKWMEMDGHGWNWMEMNGNGWKWMEMDRMAENGWK